MVLRKKVLASPEVFVIPTTPSIRVLMLGSYLQHEIEKNSVKLVSKVDFCMRVRLSRFEHTAPCNILRHFKK